MASLGKRVCAGAAMVGLIASMFWSGLTTVNAAATTVTIRLGELETYGSYSTYCRWVTHIDGIAIDLADEPGVTRSYAYCVQPSLPTPETGDYNVTVVDDDDTGRVARMRKMIYYLPGAYGYKKLTKKRWFNDLPSGTSAYAIGHVALSYLYDNCGEETDAWKGTNADIRSKVKDMVADLKNLDEPPDDFEVFWIKTSGYQDTFGAFYRTEYGRVAVKKTSANEGISAGNRCYTLAGAKYTLYTDPGCTDVAKTKFGSNAVITTLGDGSSDNVQVEIGEYYIKESSAPPGFALNETISRIEVKKDVTLTYESADVPKSNPLGLLIHKVDRETGLGRAQGSASIGGAEFTVRYYDDTACEGEPLRTWIFRTDNQGKIDVRNEAALVSEGSSPLYRDTEGKAVVPLGTLSIQETKAPAGYKLNEEVFIRHITDEGSDETLNTLNPLTGDAAVKEQVIRGDIAFTKSLDGGRRMENIPFRITSTTTGESHFVVTDANGYVNTGNSWNRHDTMDDREPSMTNGIWFNGYNDTEKGAAVHGELGAMPFDTYRIEEMPCEGNQGCTLINDTVTISREGLTILGTYDDKIKVMNPGTADDPEAGDFKPPKTGDESKFFIFVLLAILSLIEVGLLTAINKNDRLNA